MCAAARERRHRALPALRLQVAEAQAKRSTAFTQT